VLARVTWVLALVSGLVVSGSTAFAQEEEEVEAPWRAVRVEADLSSPDPDAPFWLGVEARTLALVAQPMIRPRPAETFQFSSPCWQDEHKERGMSWTQPHRAHTW